jgi:hypothetical protein
MPGKKAPAGRVIGALDENGRLIPDSITSPSFGLNLLATNISRSSCLGYGDESLIDSRHQLITKRAELPPVCNREEQIGAICTGPVFGPSWVCRSCTCNFHNALCNRHAKSAPPITHKFTYAPRMLEHFKEQAVVDYQVNYEVWREEWLEKWPANKKKGILESLKTDFDKFSEVKSFVKREPGHKEVKKARAIQGYRNLATQARLGPQVYALQKTYTGIFNHRSGRHIHDGIGITFASGMNGKQLGDWMKHVHDRFGKPWFYERDGSNWDATMQAGHQELVNILYQGVTDDETFANLQKCRNVKGSCAVTDRTSKLSTVIKYSLSETTKSGHNDTSLRNSIINAAIAYEALKILGLEAELIVAGDDLLIALREEPDVATLVRLEGTMGIIPEAGVMDDYTKTTFISGHWIKTGEDYLFVPLLGRLLLRLNWTATVIEPEDYASFNYGVAQGLKPSVGTLPIYRALLGVPKPERFTRAAARALGTKHLDVWKEEQVSPTSNIIPDAVMSWFCDRYQTIPSEILSLEAMIRAAVNVPSLVKHGLADRIIERDLREANAR